MLAANLAKGANYALLGMAVVDILGEGVDWVLDPKNNSIKYTDNNNLLYESYDGKIFSTLEAAANYNCSKSDSCLSVKDIKWEEHNNWWRVYTNTETGSGLAWTVRKSGDRGILDLETVANHIINNNITNNYYGQATDDTVAEQVRRGDHDTEINNIIRSLNAEAESNSPGDSPDTGSHTGSDQCAQGYTMGPGGECVPGSGDMGEGEPKEDQSKSDFPEFCKWAKPVCDVIDWIRKDDIDKDTGLDIPTQETPSIDTTVNFGGQCPNNISLQGSFAGQNFTVFQFEWHKFCEVLSYLKYIIISIASMIALKIVGGVNVSD